MPIQNTKQIEVVTPIKSYINAELSKKLVLSENRRRSGIYRWVNTENGKTYIGSGADLAVRLRSYYNRKDLSRNSRPITRAILKYGMDKFTLEILEYCSKPKLTNREQFYFDFLHPEYNVLKHAHSLLGFKHSKETIEKLKGRTLSPEHKALLSALRKGNHVLVSEETRSKLALATKTYRSNNPLTPEALANLKAKTTLREGVAVSVLNTQTNKVKEFTNQTEAGESLGISRQAVYIAIKRGSLVQKKYRISKITKV